MAKLFGSWINRINPVLSNTGMDYLDKYKILLCTGSQTSRKSSYLFAALDKNYKIIDISYYARNRLIKPLNITYGSVCIDIKFSQDKTYAIMFRGNALLFLKKDTDNRYYPLEPTPAGALTGSYYCDISNDGQFAVYVSASSPYFQFFRRIGDTWSSLGAISGSLVMGTVGNQSKIFDNNNIASFSNNGSSGNVVQVYAYDSGSNVFVSQTTSGLALASATPSNSISFCYSGTTKYVAVAHISAPRLRFYKTTDGLNFTDISANINTIQAFQHYSLCWDPSGTYLFVLVNTQGIANAPFCIYKRNGDNLTLLSGAFNVQPATSLATSRSGISWSKDGKFLAIGGSATATTADNGLWMYKRDGDTFTKVGGNDSPFGGNWTTGTTPDQDYQTTAGNLDVNMVVWL